MNKVLDWEPVITIFLLAVIMGWSGYLGSRFAPSPVFTAISFGMFFFLYLAWKLKERIRLATRWLIALAIPTFISVMLWGMYRDNELITAILSFLGILSFLLVPVAFLQNRYSRAIHEHDSLNVSEKFKG